jgi:hypothetical protein
VWTEDRAKDNIKPDMRAEKLGDVSAAASNNNDGHEEFSIILYKYCRRWDSEILPQAVYCISFPSFCRTHLASKIGRQ